jgi:D-arabinose 1-dehydrogenase-like Zn-dependent alcohol dehydrogenase
VPPFIPGHEEVGYVAGVGAGIKHVKSGDRMRQGVIEGRIVLDFAAKPH